MCLQYGTCAAGELPLIVIQPPRLFQASYPTMPLIWSMSSLVYTLFNAASLTQKSRLVGMILAPLIPGAFW
jgi:hypothetical protein